MMRIISRRRCIALLLLPILSLVFLSSTRFISLNIRNILTNHSERQVSSIKKINSTVYTGTTSKKAKANKSRPGPVLQLEDHIRNFVKTYTPDYPRKLFKFLKLLREKNINQTWSRNVSQTERFRKDILAAAGFLSAKRHLYLTKENTPVGTKLQFYQNGDPVFMSDDFWKILPNKTIFQERGRYKRCSIVGSSGILAGSGCGKEIDKADFIFRFNFASVSSYEHDVGTKTDFTTLNPSVVMKGKNPLADKESIAAFDALQRQFKGSLLWIPGFSQRVFFKFVKRIANVSSASGIMNPVVQHPGHYMAMMRLWRALHRRNDWPSTGLYVISAAFELCDEIEVFGFWFYERSLEGFLVPYHYHNDVMYSTRHSRFKEFQDLVNFHEMGILKMHFGRCV